MRQAGRCSSDRRNVQRGVDAVAIGRAHEIERSARSLEWLQDGGHARELDSRGASDEARWGERGFRYEESTGMRLSRSPRRPRAPRSPEGSRRLSDCALEVPPEVGLIGVAEGGCQRCERGRIRPRELHGGLVQSIALDNPFGADSHVGPEAPLKRPRVEPAGRGDVLDAEARSIAGHALHEIAQAQESRARRGDERRLGQRRPIPQLRTLPRPPPACADD